MKKLTIPAVILTATILISIITTVIAQTNTTYKIGTFPIPLMVEDKDRGVFIDLLKEIEKRSDIRLEIVVYPAKRTISEFSDKSIIGFFPALDVSIPKEVAASKEIYIKEDFAFVKQGTPIPQKIKDLEGKTIGLTMGYPYAKEIIGNDKIHKDYANDDVTNVKKLSAKRFDVFVVEEKSGLKAIEQSGEKDIIYNKSTPLSKQRVYFAFQNTPEGQSLAKKFSEALDSMKKDGTFAAIMKKAK